MGIVIVEVVVFIFIGRDPNSKLSTAGSDRMDPWVGSGWVTILPDFGGSVGSAALQIFSFLLIIS